MKINSQPTPRLHFIADKPQQEIWGICKHLYYNDIFGSYLLIDYSRGYNKPHYQLFKTLVGAQKAKRI